MKRCFTKFLTKDFLEFRSSNDFFISRNLFPIKLSNMKSFLEGKIVNYFYRAIFSYIEDVLNALLEMPISEDGTGFSFVALRPYWVPVARFSIVRLAVARLSSQIFFAICIDVASAWKTSVAPEKRRS